MRTPRTPPPTTRWTPPPAAGHIGAWWRPTGDRPCTIWNLADADERHPVVVVTRDNLIDVLSNVCVAFVTSRIRDVATQVELGDHNGLWEGCAVNALNLLTVPKAELIGYRGELDIEQLHRLDYGLAVSLLLD